MTDSDGTIKFPNRKVTKAFNRKLEAKNTGITTDEVAKKRIENNTKSEDEVEEIIKMLKDKGLIYDKPETDDEVFHQYLNYIDQNNTSSAWMTVEGIINIPNIKALRRGDSQNSYYKEVICHTLNVVNEFHKVTPNEMMLFTILNDELNDDQDIWALQIGEHFKRMVLENGNSVYEYDEDKDLILYNGLPYTMDTNPNSKTFNKMIPTDDKGAPFFCALDKKYTRGDAYMCCVNNCYKENKERTTTKDCICFEKLDKQLKEDNNFLNFIDTTNTLYIADTLTALSVSDRFPVSQMANFTCEVEQHPDNFTFKERMLRKILLDEIGGGIWGLTFRCGRIIEFSCGSGRVTFRYNPISNKVYMDGMEINWDVTETDPFKFKSVKPEGEKDEFRRE